MRDVIEDFRDYIKRGTVSEGMFDNLWKKFNSADFEDVLYIQQDIEFLWIRAVEEWNSSKEAFSSQSYKINLVERVERAMNAYNIILPLVQRRVARDLLETNLE